MSTYRWLEKDGPIEASLLELAELCSRTCHVMKAADNLGHLSEAVEDLARCVDPMTLFGL